MSEKQDAAAAWLGIAFDRRRPTYEAARRLRLRP
jgi:hypothetical protein